MEILIQTTLWVYFGNPAILAHSVPPPNGDSIQQPLQPSPLLVYNLCGRL